VKLTLDINKPKFSDFARVQQDFCSEAWRRPHAADPVVSHEARTTRKPWLRF